MPNYCCPPDHRDAIDERYGAAALEQEACLCAAVPFDPALLKVIPEEVAVSYTHLTLPTTPYV